MVCTNHLLCDFNNLYSPS